MQVDVIQGEAFEAIRDNWDAVYRADPEAHFFLSWDWLADWLAYYRTVWFVLGVRENDASGYVAFLPLRMKTQFDEERGFHNILDLAGSAFSDYAGLIVRPEHEAAAIPLLAAHIRHKLGWAKFTMDNMLMSDRRRRLLLAPFEKARFRHTAFDHIDKTDGTNHSICPWIALPSDWDAYLAGLSTNHRQKIRRLLRKVDGSDIHRIGFPEADTIERDIDMLLDFWRTKWAPRKGDQTDMMIARYRRMLTCCAERGTLLLPTFRHDGRPVALLALFVDPEKKALLFFLTGRDENYEEMPAGYLLHAHMIRHAIGEGFATYDFLMGNEAYKYAFARQERRLSATLVQTRTGRNIGEALDLRGVDDMVAIATGFDDADEVGKAERAYRQILDLVPDHPLVLYRLGRLLAKQERHDAAEDYLLRSIRTEPEGDNAWMWLARSREALGRIDASIDAWRGLLALQPENAEGRQAIVRLELKALKSPKSVSSLSVPSSLANSVTEGADIVDPAVILQRWLSMPPAGLRDRR